MVSGFTIPEPNR